MTDSEIIKALEEYNVVCDECACNEGDMTGKKIMLKALDLISRQKAEIERLKAADVAPVKHGHWVGYETKSYKNSENGIAKKYYRCSSCRYFNAIRSNYCPKCGAKMDGGDLNN